MVRILWLSRHKPQEEQIRMLQEKFGSIMIIHRDATLDSDPQKAARQLRDMMEEEGANEVVCVLPITHLAEIVKLGIKPIRAIMRRVPTGRILDNGERECQFLPEGFERVEEVKVVTKPL